MSAQQTLAVSVVVPTWRRPQMLSRCLEALVTQVFDHDDYEIIVCDDGPDAATYSMVMHWAQHTLGRPPVRYLPVSETQGPAAARNRGWRAAAGRVVAFTDDDTIPAPDWLREGLKALSSTAVAAAGRIEVPLPAQPSDYERSAADLAKAEFATANCFIRYSALAAVGGFDERYGEAWREDSDLQFALLAWGGKIARAEQAVVTHPVRPAGWGVSLRQQRKIQYDALLYKKYPQMYRSRIRRRPRRDYYLTTLSLLAMPLAAASGQRGVLLGAALLWSGLTLRLLLRRLQGTRRDPRALLEMALTSIAIPPLATFWRIVGALRYRVAFT